MCAWCIRRSMRWRWRATNPDREVIFFGLGFETTMPIDRDDGDRGERRQDIDEFLAVLQPHHHRADDQGDPRLAGPAARRVSRPGSCQHGDRHRALRVHRAALSQADDDRRVRATRRAARAMDGAEADSTRGAARSRTSMGAWSYPATAIRVALAAIAGGIRAARILRMARPGVDRSFRRAACANVMPLRCRTELRRAEHQHRRSAILPVRRSAEGRDQAVSVQGVRHRLHAGDAAGLVDGVQRRRLRGLLQLRPARQRREPAVAIGATPA